MRSLDRELLLGVGIGLILAVSLRFAGGPGGHLSDLAVVERARRLGLVFPGEERPVSESFGPGAASNIGSKALGEK